MYKRVQKIKIIWKNGLTNRIYYDIICTPIDKIKSVTYIGIQDGRYEK